MPKIELTDQLLREAVTEAVAMDYQTCLHLPKHHFPHLFLKEMKENRLPFVYNGRWTRKKLVVLAVLMILLMGMTALAVSPLGEKIGDLFFTGEPGYMKIKVEEQKQEQETFVVYAPTKLPRGYELCEEETIIKEETNLRKYSNGKNTLFFQQSRKAGMGTMGISAEGEAARIITVMGTEGYYIPSNEEGTIVVGKGEYVFTLSGTLSLIELTDILDSVEKEKNYRNKTK